MKRSGIWVLLLVLVLALSACDTNDPGIADNTGALGQVTPSGNEAEQMATPIPEDSIETVEPSGQEGSGLPDTGQLSGPLAASRVVGAQIVSPQGETLAEVSELFANVDTRELGYLAASTQQAVGLASLVPWEAISQVSRAEDGSLLLVTNVEDESFIQAPTFDLDSMNLSDPYWNEGVDQYWSPLFGEEAAGQVVTATETGPAYAPLSMLIEAPVRDLTTGEELGRVTDLVLHPQEGQAPYLIVAAGQALGSEGEWILVPLSEVTVSTGYEPGQDLNAIGSSQDGLSGEAPGPVEEENTSDLEPRPTPEYTLADVSFEILVDRDRLANAPGVEAETFGSDLENAALQAGWDEEINAYWSQP